MKNTHAVLVTKSNSKDVEVYPFPNVEKAMTYLSQLWNYRLNMVIRKSTYKINVSESRKSNDGQNAFIQWSNGNKENYTVVSLMKPVQYIGSTVKTDRFWYGMLKDIAVHMAWKVTEGKSRLTRKSIERFQTISYCFPYEDDFIDDDFVDGSVIDWYGISKIPELGFKSKDLLLVADRIGGGAASMCTLTEGMKRLDIENQLIKLMKDSAAIRGISIEKESMLVMKR